MRITAKHIYTAAKWLIVLLAYSYLTYKLIRFDNYGTVTAHFAHANWRQYLFLAITILLVPLNIGLEALKWQRLLTGVHPITFKQALHAVLIGQTGAFFTPNRIGDYPTRALLLREEQMIPAIGLGYVGSAALTAAITIFGGCAALCFTATAHPSFILHTPPATKWIFVLILLVVVLCTLIFAWRYKQIGALMSRCRQRWLHLTGEGLLQLRLRDMVAIFGLSVMRFAVFSMQMYTMLLFAGVTITPTQALIAIPTIYLFVTYTPSFAFADAAVRGSYAILVLSLFDTNTAGMALAGVLLWVINYCLPMMAGSILLNTTHKA